MRAEEFALASEDSVTYQSAVRLQVLQVIGNLEALASARDSLDARRFRCPKFCKIHSKGSLRPSRRFKAPQNQ